MERELSPSPYIMELSNGYLECKKCGNHSIFYADSGNVIHCSLCHGTGKIMEVNEWE